MVCSRPPSHASKYFFRSWSCVFTCGVAVCVCVCVDVGRAREGIWASRVTHAVRTRYSNTSVSFRSVCTTSYRRTMLGCCSSFSREISRMAVEGMPAAGRGESQRTNEC